MALRPNQEICVKSPSRAQRLRGYSLLTDWQAERIVTSKWREGREPWQAILALAARSAAAARVGSDCAPEKGALQVPAQTVYSFRGTNAVEAERIVLPPDHAAVGRNRGLISNLPARVYRALYPMRIQGRARVGEVDDGSRQFLFESVLRFGKLCLRVIFGYVGHVGVSHGVRPDRVAVAC